MAEKSPEDAAPSPELASAAQPAETSLEGAAPSLEPKSAAQPSLELTSTDQAEPVAQLAVQPVSESVEAEPGAQLGAQPASESFAAEPVAQLGVEAVSDPAEPEAVPQLASEPISEPAEAEPVAQPAVGPVVEPAEAKPVSQPTAEFPSAASPRAAASPPLAAASPAPEASPLPDTPAQPAAQQVCQLPQLGKHFTPAAVQPAQKHWTANELVNHQLTAPKIPKHTLRTQDHLREALKVAITKDDAQAIQTLIRKGAPLYRQYFHGPAGPGASYLQKLGMVNPVEWATMNLRFRAAMQILELSEGRLMYTEARPRPAKFEEFRLAAETKLALSIAAKHGHLGLMRMLLEQGCSIGQKDTEGRSALRVATQAGKAEAVSLLLQYGAWQVEEQNAEVLAAAKQKGVLPTFLAFGIALPLETIADVTLDVELRPITALPYLQLQPSSPSSSPIFNQSWSPPTHKPTTPTAGARREACLKHGYSNSVTARPAGSARPTSMYKAGNAMSDSIASWGWAPHGSLPSTPSAAAAGGAVYLPMAGVQIPGASRGSVLRELTSDEVRLRGELTRAIRKSDIDKIRGLLARGVPLEAAFDLGYGEKGNCVDWACVCAKPTMALSLLRVADEKGMGNSLAQTARAAFFWSVTQGYPEVLEELLRRGADVSMKAPLKTLEMSPGNQSALGAAIVGTRKAEVAILLKYGAWSYESEPQRAQLLEWAMCRKPIADAFHEAGIGVGDKCVAVSPEKTILADRARIESMTPSTRAPTATPGESGRPWTGYFERTIAQGERPETR